jgi:hypothetical protein
MGGMLFKAKVVCITALATITIWTTDHLPQKVRRKLLSSEYHGEDLEERLAVTIFSGWPTTRALYRMLTVNMRPKLKIGQHVGDLKVVRLGSQREVKLTELSSSPLRPLVLNFGSCTWPPFLSQLPKFLEMQREYAGVADFAIVYLEEAHPTDGWMYPRVKHLTEQPTTFAKRCGMAHTLDSEMKALLASPSITVCVDRMDNAVSYAFGALPERLAVIKEGKVQFLGGAGPSAYSIPACSDALKKLIWRWYLLRLVFLVNFVTMLAKNSKACIWVVLQMQAPEAMNYWAH